MAFRPRDLIRENGDNKHISQPQVLRAPIELRGEIDKIAGKKKRWRKRCQIVNSKKLVTDGRICLSMTYQYDTQIDRRQEKRNGINAFFDINLTSPRA